MSGLFDCPNCGTRVLLLDDICPACRKSVSDSEGLSNQEARVEGQFEVIPQEAKNRRRFTIWAIAGALVAMALGGLLLFRAFMIFSAVITGQMTYAYLNSSPIGLLVEVFIGLSLIIGVGVTVLWKNEYSAPLWVASAFYGFNILLGVLYQQTVRSISGLVFMTFFAAAASQAGKLRKLSKGSNG